MTEPIPRYETRGTWPGSVNVTAATPTRDDLDALLSEMRRGLLMVIKAIEKYQDGKRGLQSGDNS